MAKTNAKITVTGTFTKIVIKLGDGNKGAFKLTVAGTEIAATSNAEGVITFELPSAQTGEFIIQETGKGTGIVSAVEFWNVAA